jgi:hypothetical protein
MKYFGFVEKVENTYHVYLDIPDKRLIPKSIDWSFHVFEKTREELPRTTLTTNTFNVERYFKNNIFFDNILECFIEFNNSGDISNITLSI